MKKKSLLRIFLGAFALLLALILLWIADFTNNGPFATLFLFRWIHKLDFICAILLGIWGCKMLWPARPDAWWWASFNFGVAFGVGFVLLALVNRLSVSSQDPAYHSNPTGNCNHYFHGAVSSRVGQKTMQVLLSASGPLINGYVYWPSEEDCRALNLQAAIGDGQSPLCKSVGAKDAYSCLMTLIDRVTEKTPFTAGGYIELVASGVSDINKDKTRFKESIGRDLTEAESSRMNLEIVELGVHVIDLMKTRKLSPELYKLRFDLTVQQISLPPSEELAAAEKNFIASNYNEVAAGNPHLSQEDKKLFFYFKNEEIAKDFQQKMVKKLNSIVVLTEGKLAAGKSPASADPASLDLPQKIQELKRQLNALSPTPPEVPGAVAPNSVENSAK